MPPGSVDVVETSILGFTEPKMDVSIRNRKSEISNGDRRVV
jgi:hypothetical protein